MYFARLNPKHPMAEVHPDDRVAEKSILAYFGVNAETVNLGIGEQFQKCRPTGGDMELAIGIWKVRA